MEPANLNSPANPNDDARLEAMLRRATPELPDNGFSARVLADLPERREPRPSSSAHRLVFCVVGAVAGCGFALWRGVSAADLESGADRFGNALVNLGSALADPMLVAALVATVSSLLVVFRAEVRDKLLS